MKLFAVAAVGASARMTYDEYKAEFGKFYNDDNEDARKAVFEKNMDKIESLNQQNSRWEAGVNQFTDMDDVSAFLGFVPGEADNATEPELMAVVASSKDWRSRMPAVKNQQQCGSCWTFSATAVVDFFSGQSHSEQQVGDCTSNNLCNGGNPYTALQYLAQGHKHALSSSYPYQGSAHSCKSVSSGATISAAHSTSGANGILNIVQNQVVAVGFRLSQYGPFMSYKRGVYDSDCGTGEGHAVAIVGYQSDYWIVRNSWGGSWGENGYFYFAKGKNLCQMEASGWYATGVSTAQAELVI